MKINFKTGLLLLSGAIFFGSCKKKVDVNILDTGNFSETGTALKDAASFPVGVAIGFTPMTTDTKYSDIVKRDFDEVVFEYHMKHGAVVQDNGTFNYTNTDALVNAAGAMNVFGHTLAWHSNQNATYLKNFSGLIIPAATELLGNPGFEGGLTGWSTFNSGNPAGTSTITTGSGAAEVRTGTGSMKVINPTGYPGSQWRVQVSSIQFPTTAGKQYRISYWVKAATAGGSIRLSSGPTSAQYQGDQTIGTAWQEVSWTITANLSMTSFLFDMGQAANTYFIDDASVKEVIPAPSGAAVAAKLDQALGDFITNMVNRYKGKVRAWDVVNEAVSPSGAYRTTATTTDIPNMGAKTDLLMWSDYLGRDYVLKAFNYAKAADPAADLYINDFGLESSTVKTDSLVALVNEMKGKGAKIDGIGTQMHISWNSSRDGIDKMFQKLAATGLKIRVSELDVKTLLGSASGKPTALQMAYQAEMIKYVVASYIKHIPSAQRAGITIWGVVDKYSWLYNNGTEFPLIYDNDYNKKPAYSGFLQGLQ